MRSRRATIVVALVAFAATGAVYLGIAENEPLRWDDRANLVENPHIRSFSAGNVGWMLTTTHLGPWQPLSWITLAADHAVWGGDPTGHYVGNLLLHALAAALLALAAARLFRIAVPGLAKRPGALAAAALAAALLWSCHPLRVESVAWATERRDVLSGMLLIGALVAWLRYAGPGGGGRGAYVGAVLLYAASLFAKATAMGLFLVLVLLDAWPLRRPIRSKLVEKLPFLALGLAAAVVAWLGQSGTDAVVGLDEVSLPGRIVLAGHAAAFLVAKTLLPLGLRAHYARPVPFDPAATGLVVGTAFTVLVTVATIVFRRRVPAVAVAWWSFLFLLAPVSGLTITGSHLVADRYGYLPALALTLLAVGAVAALVSRRAKEGHLLLAGSPLLVLPFLIVGTLGLVASWKDDETVWTRVAELEPSNWVANEQLAAIAVERGERGRAMMHLTISLEGMPGRAKALTGLAYLEVESGRDGDALRHARAAVAADPDRAPAWRVLGLALAVTGDPAGAERAFRRGLSLAPDSVETRGDYAECLLFAGRFADAEVQTRAALERDPGRTALRVMLGAALAEQEKLEEARAELESVLEVAPENALARLWLAKVHARAGRHAEAEAVYRRLLDVVPGHRDALVDLAKLLGDREEWKDAAACLERVLARSPDDAWTRLDLGAALARSGQPARARIHLERALRAADSAGDARCAEAVRAELGRLD